jgi:hypothetical protein
MIKERNQIAEGYRSLGEAEKANLLGKLENEQRTILSDAYRRSEEIKVRRTQRLLPSIPQAYSRMLSFLSSGVPSSRIGKHFLRSRKRSPLTWSTSSTSTAKRAGGER